MVKYVRMTTALLACCRPNMGNLAKNTDISKSVPVECISELLLLRLLFQMYDEAEGGGAKREEYEKLMKIEEEIKIGMKIEDIVELLSCCACSAKDEVDIENESEDMLTVSICT